MVSLLIWARHTPIHRPTTFYANRSLLAVKTLFMRTGVCISNITTLQCLRGFVSTSVKARTFRVFIGYFTKIQWGVCIYIWSEKSSFWSSPKSRLIHVYFAVSLPRCKLQLVEIGPDEVFTSLLVSSGTLIGPKTLDWAPVAHLLV